jgi:rare lipoprotein A
MKTPFYTKILVFTVSIWLITHVAAAQLFPSEGYSEMGVASYYAAMLHGLRTANGETFSNTDFTAAHRKLPFNTLVKVRSLKNDKSVVVRINDRGPVSKNRLIDLSRPAARKLGIMTMGLTKVEVTELSVISITPEKKEVFFLNKMSTLDGEPATPVGIKLLLWESSNLEHVVYMGLDILMNMDFPELFVRTVETKGQYRHGIVMAGLQSKSETQSWIKKLNDQGFNQVKELID